MVRPWFHFFLRFITDVAVGEEFGKVGNLLVFLCDMLR